MRCNYFKKAVTTVIRECAEYVPKDKKLYISIDGKIKKLERSV